MYDSVKLRVSSIPSVLEQDQTQSIQVLFSGGLDSTVLAAILMDVLDPKISIDLVNVSFDPLSSPDRVSALFAYGDLINRNQGRKMRLLFADHDM